MLAGQKLKSAAPLLVALATSLVLLVGLRDELSIGRSDLNDHRYHGPIIARMAEAIEQGENPLDCWMGEWTLGFPVPRVYQPLSHLATAALWLGTFKLVALGTLFVVLRTLLLAAWPLTTYASARLFGLDRWTASCCALVAPLLSAALYGLELGSHAWRGSGLYTQLWAMHAFALAVPFGTRAVRRGSSCALAAAAIAVTFGCHLIYGQMAALSVAAIALLPSAEAPWRTRLVRLGAIGALTAAFAAWQLGPLLADGPIVNHSRWESSWKWDSLGLARVGELLWNGDLLDKERLPVITALALLGAVAAAWRAVPAERAVVVLAGAWLALFAGRPAWGPFLQLLAIGPDVHLHRLVGGAHFFLILTAGIGLAALARLVASQAPARLRGALALAAVALALAPAVKERRAWLGKNREWGERNLAAWQAEKDDVARVIEACAEAGGRTHPGLAAKWGRELKVGDVPLYAFLSDARVPTVAFLYHSMALTSDIMVLFDENDPAQYRVFGITRVASAKDRQMPSFLEPAGDFGRFRAWKAPGNGFFDLVDVAAVARCDRTTLYDVSSKWLWSDWPERFRHVALDMGGRGGTAPGGLPRLQPDDALFPVEPAELGRVVRERRFGETYTATVEATAPCHVLFKMTWHPGWRIEIDGIRAPAIHVTPGFIAAPVTAGRHEVRCRYEPGRGKLALLLAIPLVAGASVALGRRGALRALERRVEALPIPRLPPQRRAALLTAAVAAALCAPFVAQLLHGQLVNGHDHRSYLARLVELHENVRAGILLPRWAPDLGSGHGQPLFLFAPPLLYWVAESWHLAGFDIAWSMNLAAALVVIASAVAMHRLAAPLFGPAGGRLATLAYVLAPYFCADLFVRQALAEFAAFPAYPLVLDGLLRHERTGRRRWLAQSAVAFAALACTHPPAALLFAPVPPLLAVVLAARRRSAALLARQAAALATGLLVAAFAWLPGLLEKRHVKMERLLEHDALRYENHFVQWHQLIASKWGHGLSVAGPGDGMSFELGRVHLVLAAVALVVAWRRRDLGLSRALLAFAAGIVATWSVLMTPWSKPLWDRVQTLQYVQFEWRLLSVTTVALALLAGAAGRALEAFGPRRGALLGIAAGALLLVNLPHVQSSGRTPVDLAEWTPGEIARRGKAVTTAEEYEPRVVEKAQPWAAERIAVSPGIVIESQAFGPEHARALVRSERGGEVWVRNYAYPGWTAFVDGRQATHRVASPSGFVIVDVGPGTHEVEVVLERTGVQRAGLALSFLGLASLAGLLSLRLMRGMPSEGGVQTPPAIP